MAPTPRNRLSSALKRPIRRVTNQLLSLRGVHGLARSLARRGLLPERIWSGYPLSRTIEIDCQGGSCLYEVRSGDYVGMPLYWRGRAGYESETLGLLPGLVANAEVFFDIGANTGIYSLLAARANPSLRIWAFEPLAETYKQLERNIALNGIENRVIPVHAAVGSSPGEAEFFVPEGVFPKSASLSDVGMAEGRHRVARVKLESIDSFCRSHPVPDLVKIDVEGCEDQVLSGMRESLLRHKPKIIIESLADGPFRQVQEILAAAGYRFAHLDGGPLEWRDDIRPEPGTTHRNWLCLPRATDPSDLP